MAAALTPRGERSIGERAISPLAARCGRDAHKKGAAVLVAVLTPVVADSVIALARDSPATSVLASSQSSAGVNEQRDANQEVAGSR